MNYSVDFEIGDKITKPLIAVSEQCSKKRGVFFGPAPKYESFIVYDPDVFCCYKGPITPINLRNGTYEIDIKENTHRTYAELTMIAVLMMAVPAVIL